MNQFMTLEAGAQSGSPLSMIAMLAVYAVFILALYFIFFRPQSKKKKKEAEMRKNAQVGDEITTIGGIIGKIVMVGEETIVIETSDDRVRMELTKWAVSTNNTQQQNAAADKKDKKADKEEPAKIEEGSESETK